MGSMNMPGISLHLLNLTNVTADFPAKSTTDLLDMIDAPHRTSAWPTTHNMYPVPADLKDRLRKDKFVESKKDSELKKEVAQGPKLTGESGGAAWT
jgi:dihydroxyacetone kinase